MEIPRKQKSAPGYKGKHHGVYANSKYKYTGIVWVPKWFSETAPQQKSESAKREHGRIETLRKVFELIYFITAGPCLLTVSVVAAYIAISTLAAVKEQVEEMRQENVIEHMPWIFAYEPSVRITETNTMIFSVRVKNIGKTPAINVINSITIMAGPDMAAVRFTIPTVDTPIKKSPDMIPPGAEPIEETVPSMADIPLYMRLQKHEIGGYLYGTIWYDDMFNHSHTNQFCFAYINGGFQTAGFHNSCSDVEIHDQK